MAEVKAIFVGGVATNDEVEHGKDLARRYRCEFVDLKNFHIQHELFRKIKVDYMFRYNFVPLEEKDDGRLIVAIADPSQLMMIDEISLLLGRRIVTKVATLLPDRRRSEEDGAVAARAGRSGRKLCARRYHRGRE